jgi:hypothetical protein
MSGIASLAVELASTPYANLEIDPNRAPVQVKNQNDSFSETGRDA